MDYIEEETIWRPQASGQESLIDEFMEKFYTEDDRPNMIFSVIGDSNSLVPKIWPKSRFQVTLTYAAKAAGVSWILSQGEPLKISKIIREMVEEYVYLEKPNQASPIRLVSIPSKEVVDNETLYFDLPEVYENETKDEYNNSVYMSLRAHACNTDYIDFRLTFESRLHRPQANERNAVLLVLVEGDLSAVDHVRRATESGIPVVVVQGTGGAADLLAQHINAVKNGQKLDWRIFLPTLFGIQLEEVGVNELERDLETIGEKAFLVDVFDLQNKNEEEFAAMVGELVYRAWSHEEMGYVKGNRQNNTIGRSHKKVLRKDRSRSYCVSVNWKREKSTWHIAKIHETHSLTSFSSPFSLPLDFFFQFSKHLNENDSRVSEQFTETAKELLLEALLTNRTDYVEALLDLNLSLSTEQIDKLYHKRFQTNEDPSDDIKKDDLFWVIKNMAKKKNAFQLLEGNKTHLNAQKIVKQILHYEETEDPRLEAGCSTKRRKSYVVRQMSLQAILLWSLLTNKADISTLMWKRVANQLYTGIVSSVILKIMASHAELKDKNLAKSLDEHSKTFKIRALNMMDTLFQTDKKVAFNIMDNLETVWKIQATPIAFAYEFQMYDVIAHPSTVALMNKKWYRGMVPSWKQLFTKALRNPCFVFNMRCSHFVLHYILFGITLMMYSYFLLTDVKPLRNLSAKDAICEMTLYLWTTLDFINDVISVFGTLCRKVETRRHKKRKFFSRLNDMWKLFGLICFCLVIFTFSVRWKKSTKFRMVKRIAALLLLFSYLRYMRVFALRKFTGISFMFLKYMLYNLLKFLIVVAFLIIGVGVFYEALRDNSGMDMSGKWYEWSLWNILFHPFYQLFGEMFEDKFGFDGNPDKNQKTDWSVKMVAAVFMMVGNLLVISLITAFFTTTYDEVLAKSEKMWQYESFAGSGGEVYPDCPSPVQKYAFQCFTGYNTQMLNMVKSSATLFSGVDVEIIRAFCSAYNQAMVCIENMKEICPVSLHRKIEATLMNLQGAKPEVSALCTDDNIYERYARHMTCLREYGAYSERCFRDGMNSSIRLMQWISEDDIYQLCSDLNRTVDCITSKIGRWCGPEAAQLIPILVKPMVRKSTKCDVMPLSGLGTALMTTLRRRPYRQETITSKPNIFNTPKADTPDQRHVIYANPYNSSASNTPLTSLTVIITSLCGLPYIILHHLHN